MERKSLTPLDFLTDNVSPIQNTQNKSVFMRGSQIIQSPQVTYQKGASPTTYGPSPSELPLFEQSASGAILFEKWGNESPASIHQTQCQQPPNEDQSHHEFQKKTQLRTQPKTADQAQNRIKAEVDAARFKIAAAEAQNENERMRKLLSDEHMSSEKLKIKLRNEISNHAQTVEQSRSITTIAQQLRSKNEAYENEISGLKNGLSAVQNENRELREKLSMQDSRVDALARICKGLEVQLRELVARNEGNLPQLDVAAQWRNHAYKAMVKANHNEARLNAQINKLHQINNQLSYPPLQGPMKQRQLMPSVD